MDGSFVAVTISPQEPTGQIQAFWPGGGEFFKWLYPWGREWAKSKYIYGATQWSQMSD